jgi:hypothetical protein
MDTTLRPYLSCQHQAASTRVTFGFPVVGPPLVTIVRGHYLRNLAGFNHLAHNTRVCGRALWVHEPWRRMRFPGSGAECANQAGLTNWLLRIDIKRRTESESSIGEFGYCE